MAGRTGPQGAQARLTLPYAWKRRATHSGDAPPMGVSFHQVARRFEGRESATNNLGPDCDQAAEPKLNATVRNRRVRCGRPTR